MHPAMHFPHNGGIPSTLTNRIRSFSRLFPGELRRVTLLPRTKRQFSESACRLLYPFITFENIKLNICYPILREMSRDSAEFL
jgi:hypothetical protein